MLQLRLLGAFAIVRDGHQLVLPPSKRTRALLAYLAVTGRRHSRERLCSVLWGIPDDPRGALRWSLSKLRPIVDESDRLRIRADRDSVAFDGDGVDIDVVAVRDLAATGFGSLPTMTLEELAGRFAGDFLEGLELPDQPEFTAWCIARRDESLRLHIELRRALIERYAAGAESALRHARTLCAIDSLSETSHAALCRLLRATGRIDEAEHQYNASLRYLADQGVELSGELAQSRTATRGPLPNAGNAPPAVEPAAAPRSDIDAATLRKPASVLFAAFPGFLNDDPAYTQDTEVVLERIDALTRLVVPLVGVFCGEIITAGSAGILAIFGAPLAQEDHAARACHAALEIQRAAVRADACGLRIGLASGEIIVRPGSGAQTWEALGRAVELAPRVAYAAQIGGVAVSEAVFTEIEGLFAAQPFTHSGERFYRVIGASAMSTPWRARSFRSLARFTGRTFERAIFDRALEDSRRGCGTIVAVIGEAGIGKSRMISENLDRTRERGGWRTFEIGTSPRETQTIFAPLRVMLQTWLATSPETPPRVSEELLRNRLIALGSDYTDYAPALLNVLGLPVEDSDWLRLGAEQRRQNTIEALVAILLRESDDLPVIVLFEDLQWVDESSEEFLKLLASALAYARFLLVVTCRPEYSIPWGNRPNYVQCRLDPLSDVETHALLDDMLGADSTLRDIKSKLARHCDGNPFFLEECVRTLIETQSLVGPVGACTAARPLAQVSTPSTVQALLAARIDRLTPHRRLVLQAAAVSGRSFTSELLATVTEQPLAAVREALAELEAAEFVSLARLKPLREYQFVHALTQQVTYGAMLHARRTALHRAVGTTLLRQAGERASEIVETIADHFDTGELWEEASDYRLRAARRSKEQYAYEVALEHAARAVASALAANRRERQIEGLTLIGDLHSLLGDIETANEQYAAALAMCDDSGAKARIAARRHVVRSIVRDGGRIAFYEHGSGSQTLVFVHPFVYGVATFQPLVEQLSADFSIITIDPRGAGSSDPLPARYGINDHMLDVVAVLRAATQSQPVSAVGISRGALLLIRLAALHPALLSKMVLVGAPLKQTVGVGVPTLGTPAFEPDELALFADALRCGDISTALEMFAPTIFSERGTDALQRRFIEHCLKMPAATVVNFFTFDPDADVTDCLERVVTPTLIVHGTEDLDTPVSTAVELSLRIPRAQLHLFEGKGHLPMFTATADFCAVVRKFVAPDLRKRGPMVAADSLAEYEPRAMPVSTYPQP